MKNSKLLFAWPLCLTFSDNVNENKKNGKIGERFSNGY